MNGNYIKKLKTMCAAVPIYSDSKSIQTCVYYANGEMDSFKFSVKRIMNDYCAVNMTSFECSKKLSSEILTRKNNIPVIIKDSVILPVKTVKPYFKGDKCFGYVDISYIDNFKFEDKNIVLTNGNIINFIEKEETVKKRIAECTLLTFKLCEEESLLHI